MIRKRKTIETERLILREISLADVSEIVLWRSNPEVYCYFKEPHKITKKEHVLWYLKKYLFNNNRIDFICLEKESGDKIGVFGVVLNSDSVEVNYLLSPEAQHKGYANEAIKQLISYSKEIWSIDYITAEIHKDNKASISVAKKIGFEEYRSDGDFLIFRIEV